MQFISIDVRLDVEPSRWVWPDLAEVRKELRCRTNLLSKMSSGNTKRIQRDDRLLLLRQNQDRGLIGSGWARSTVFTDDHWDGSSRTSNYVDFEITAFLPDGHLPIEVLLESSTFPWNNIQASGLSLDPQNAAIVEGLWAEHLSNARQTEVPGLVSYTAGDEDRAYPEGGVFYRLHVSRERNRALVREKKNSVANLVCEVCGFDFAAVYGDDARGFIECHHKLSLASYGDRRTTRLEDLALVCANCHRVLHRPPHPSPEELRQIVTGRRTRDAKPMP
ncbi:MAG: HNH endonuclease [Nannocystaceae bacterium]